MSMTNEQREAIDRLSSLLKKGKYGVAGKTLLYEDYYMLKNVLEIVENQEQKIIEQQEEIEHLKENIDYKTLCDFLMSSVSDEEEPIWTEKHIEELLDNFEVRWKDAHK